MNVSSGCILLFYSTDNIDMTWLHKDFLWMLSYKRWLFKVCKVTKVKSILVYSPVKFIFVKYWKPPQPSSYCKVTVTILL